MEKSVKDAFKRLDKLISQCGKAEDRIDVIAPLRRACALGQEETPNTTEVTENPGETLIRAICPRCRRPLVIYSVIEMDKGPTLIIESGEESNYCSDCGQRIDYKKLKEQGW